MAWAQALEAPAFRRGSSHEGFLSECSSVSFSISSSTKRSTAASKGVSGLKKQKK